jgi:peroxiredoxin
MPSYATKSASGRNTVRHGRPAPLLLMLLILLAACPALAAELPKEGETLPQLTILTPALEKDCQYLGLDSPGTFTIQDLDYSLILLELVGVYCPYCHKQAPLFNSLFKRLERTKLDDRVKMLAVASGATEPEVVQLRKHSGYVYPVLRDEDFSMHKTLGEPQTPFTLLVNREGTILYTKLGVVEDIDALFETIRKAVE